MKKTVITLILVFFFVGKSYSQGSIYKCEDTLFIKLICINKGKQISQQMIKVFCKDSVTSIRFYDKHKIQIVPKEGLDKEKLAIAELLIKLKDSKQLPEQYNKYLSIPINDSINILKLLESYDTVQTFNQLKSTTVNCLQKFNEWFMEKSKSNKTSKNKKRTKVEFKEGRKTNIYFVDGYYDSRQVFKCLFN